jgi:hypothetical protein
MIVPLYPNEGDRYNDPMNEDSKSYIMENIYQIKRGREYYINSIVMGN